MGQTDFSQLSFGSELAHRCEPIPRVCGVRKKLAEEIRLASGLTAVQKYLGQGWDWEKMLEQRVLEKEKAAKLGIEERGPVIQFPSGVSYSQVGKMVKELETLQMGSAVPAISKRKWWQELGGLLRRMGFKWPV